MGDRGIVTGIILRNMRHHAHLSQQQIAKLLPLADTTISSYERGNSQPDFEMICKIAKICGYEIWIKTPEREFVSVEKMSKEV